MKFMISKHKVLRDLCRNLWKLLVQVMLRSVFSVLFFDTESFGALLFQRALLNLLIFFLSADGELKRVKKTVSYVMHYLG